MADQLLLIKYIPTPDGKSVHLAPSHIEKGSTHKLHIMGCVDFELYNQGTTSVLIFNSVEIAPGQSYSPRKSTNLPFAEDIDMRWADDPELTRSPSNISTSLPPAGTVQR
jgi:hypothetical protein